MKQNRYQEYHATKDEKLSKLYQMIGYSLRDDALGLLSITCSNFAKEYNDCAPDKIYEHDGLAVVGDAILKAILSITYFNAEITEGHLTEIKKDLENNAVLQVL
jgi:dsRNA-specific ribonuclease